jgi:hypothetical protein
MEWQALLATAQPCAQEACIAIRSLLRHNALRTKTAQLTL